MGGSGQWSVGVVQCTAFQIATASSQVDREVTIRVSGHFASHDAASGNAPEPSHTIVLPEQLTWYPDREPERTVVRRLVDSKHVAV